MKKRHRFRLLAAGLATALVAIAVGSAAVMKEGAATAASCPPGFKPAATACVSVKHPESLVELELRGRQVDAVRAAPHARTHPGAFAGALEQRAAMPASVKGSEGTWRPLGQGPLRMDGPAYNSVNGLGLANVMGRIDSLELTPAKRPRREGDGASDVDG